MYVEEELTLHLAEYDSFNGIVERIDVNSIPLPDGMGGGGGC
jgi:hypothetical protein